MKNATTLLLCLAFYAISAQNTTIKYNLEDGASYAERIIELPNKSAEEVYDLAYGWILGYFREPDEVIDAKKEGDFIRGRGFAAGVWILTSFPRATSDLMYDFKIEVKDNKARLTITNIRNSHGYTFDTYVFKKDGTVKSTVQSRNAIESVEAHLNSLLDSFNEHMLNTKKKDDW